MNRMTEISVIFVPRQTYEKLKSGNKKTKINNWDKA